MAIIVLRFIAPDGTVGFTDHYSTTDALKCAKTYKSFGYRLDSHFIIHPDRRKEVD